MCNYILNRLLVKYNYNVIIHNNTDKVPKLNLYNVM